MKADEPKPAGEVVVNAKVAGVIAPAAAAGMFWTLAAYYSDWMRYLLKDSKGNKVKVI